MSSYEFEIARCELIDRFESLELETYIELLDLAGNLEPHLILQTIHDLPRTDLVTKIIYKRENASHFEQLRGFCGKTPLECAAVLAERDCTNFERWCANRQERMNFDAVRIYARAEHLFQTYAMYHLQM